MSVVVTVPSEILRVPAKPVVTIDPRVLQILKDMKKVLEEAKDPQGVGLAAPQIGESLSIFMIRPDPKGEITTFINPQIIKYSQRQTNPTGKKGVYEGCLSLPRHYAPVRRSESVTVRYQTPDNNSPLRPPLKLRGGSEGALPILVEKTETYSGFPAHVIQHEMDHLNGILFIDRVLEQNAKLYKTEGEDWHEITL